MNLFTVNQVNQVYALKQSSTFASGDDAFAGTKGSGNIFAGVVLDTTSQKPKSIYFKYAGPGGVVRTDLIDLDKIMYVSLTPAAKMRKVLKEYQLNTPGQGSAVTWSALDADGTYMRPGYDFILRIALDHYIGISPEDSQYWKYGMVHTGPNMTPNAFWKEMAKSILRNMSREAVKFIKVYGVINGTTQSTELTLNNFNTEWKSTFTGIAIREVEPDWILGLKQQKVMGIEVTPIAFTADKATDDGSIVYWGYTDDNNVQTYDHKLEAVNSSETINNGKLTADYEYFFLGERADQYRKVGWPDYIPTEYMVDPSKEYDYLQIHYSYIGSNEGAQRSEKDLTFLVPTGSSVTNSIKTFIATQAEARELNFGTEVNKA